MNTTERAYAQRLERLKREGKIESYSFEEYYIPLADRCCYVPDFRVRCRDGGLEYHEVKAMWTERKVGWREDAKIKFKWACKEMAASVFVLAALHKDGSWHLEEFNGESATITPEERAAGRSGVHALLAQSGGHAPRGGRRVRRIGE